MPNIKPSSKSRKPSLKDPEWWTSIAVSILDMKPGSLAKDLAKLLKTDKTDVFQELASLYEDAMNQCVGEHGISVKLAKKDREKADFANFDPHFPTWQPVFLDLAGKAGKELEKKTGDEGAGERLEEYLRGEFGNCFNSVREMDKEKYRNANRYIDLIIKGHNTPEGELCKHTNEILKSAGSDPLPIDPDLTLWQIYVTPAAKYWEDKIRDKTKKNKKEVPNLMESLLETLRASTSAIIIHGQPGHGKTSSVRMLAHAVVTKEREEKKTKRTNVLMYEFKNLGRLDDHEIRVLANRTPFVQNEKFFRGKNTVLILDGMDERQITDGSDYSFKEFVRRMFNLSENVNRETGSKFNLILTGRSQFVRQVQSAFSADYHLYEIRDFSEAQVEAWLKKYCLTKRYAPPLQYGELKKRHLKDLVHQPILLTISSMMLVDEEGRKLMGDLKDGQITRSEIYRSIIKWTYLKKWQRRPSFSDLPDEETYTRFLKIVAFVLFRSGGENIKISRLVESCRKNNTLYELEVIENKTDEKIGEICKTLAVSFFFKGLEENTFSFIHKTVKDYLTAEAVFDLLKEAATNFDPGKPAKSCDSMASDIYFILGGAALSSGDHIPFLRNLLADRKKEAMELFEPLRTFFKMAKNHAYLIRNENAQNNNPLVTEANVLSSLFYFMTEIFNIMSDEEKKKNFPDGYLKLFDDKDDFYKMFNLINSTEYDRFYGHKFQMNEIDIGNSELGCLCLIGENLVRANLSNADLSNADLSNANLRNANLSYANLSYANLRHANLIGANLSRANLVKANLIKTDLSYADLSYADLSNANLTNAITRGAIFTDADMTDVIGIEDSR